MLILLNTHPMIWLLVPQFAGCCRERCVLATLLLRFYLILSLEYTPLFFHFAWLCVGFSALEKRAISPSLEGMALCRGWNLSFNPALALDCPSNLCGCPSSLFHISWLPWVEGIPRPVSVPKGKISVSTWIHADWKLDPQAAALKLWKSRQSHRTASVSPTDHLCQGI